MTDTTTLPIAPTTFWLLVILVALVLAILIAAVAKPADPTGPSSSAWSRFLTRIGLDKVPPVTALFVSLFWAALALTLAGGILATIYAVPSALATSTSNPDDATLRWTLLTLTALTGALGAVVALPFTLIRIRQTQRQTDLQDEALFNDKINAAATDLAARRQVTRVLHKGTPEEYIATEWEDDLVTRAAAIDRLEGLALEAMERGDYSPAQRIARMLSIYVQELSRQFPAKTPLLDLFIERKMEAKEGTSIAPEEVSARTGYSIEQLQSGVRPMWASLLKPSRKEVERAVKSLSKINPIDARVRDAFEPTNIDLSDSNLQGFDLERANLRGVCISGAKLQGAILGWANLDGANATAADMRFCNLIGLDLTDAILVSTQLEGAQLTGAILTTTHLWNTNFRGASLWKTRFNDTNLATSILDGTLLRNTAFSGECHLDGASLRGAGAYELTSKTLSGLKMHWSVIFYAEANLPAGHPPHWIAEDLDYDTFTTQWRAWAATLDPPVTIAPDYRGD